ncbi:DUF1206 domain-containing protein [Phycicoccus sp. DTK01]|uniref:DUF1206 domain-containing protein n=1 Tax=Phycicoccus sp. DTK01 TaxID=2785745 RepID=UPI001A8D389B|nr:DUF1206 domain-containing protein [Phycicoccus sp. DTK01]GIL36541.1 hypothetical protein PDTK01_26160 [Phycicoccus sp. DTK01]
MSATPTPPGGTAVPDDTDPLEHVRGAAADLAAPVVDAAHDAFEAVAETAHQVAEVTAQAAEVAETHAAVSTGARLGFFLDGLLHAAMGWAGLQIVWLGHSRSTADESGALTSIATSLGGRAVLWVGVVGFAVVTVWNLARALTGRHCHTRLKRLEHAADGIAYATVAWAAAAFAIGAGQTSRDSTVGITRTLLALPGGVLLVVGTGIAVAGVGAFSIWSGLSRDFLVDLARRPGRLLVLVGIVGFVARGVAFGIVGLLFVIAAWTHDVSASTGIDGALRFLQDAPAGRYALAVVSLGLVAFGVYLMTRARHLLR